MIVCAGELGADLAGIGVVQAVEDGQRLPPGVAGMVRLAGGEARVTKVGEGRGFVILVAELAEDTEGVLVAGRGLGKIA